MTASARWLIPDEDAHQVRILADELRLQGPAARVLVARGYREPERAQEFLNPSLDSLHDPFLMKGMPEAVARLVRAIRCREKILLYGDYDVDGTSSVVILKKAIELAGGQAGFHVPHRVRDGYGMRSEVIEEASRNGVTLIVSVDTGIRAVEVVDRARTLGIDVIVTDHHLPEEAALPAAVAVLNPNQHGCPYPEKSLCGAGVALKLVQGLLCGLEWPAERARRLVESFLKIAAIATVADVVPLTGENRVIVKHGLEGLRDVRNPGLRELIQVSGLAPGERPTAGQVAFRIAPRINAAGRMDSAGEVIELFLTSDEQRAREIASQLNVLNQERQQTEDEIRRAIFDSCARTPVAATDAALVFSAPGWHRGVVGIVASRVVDHYHRPVIILSEDPEQGEASGSGRSIRAFHLLEALEAMPELFTRFGGHRQAVGLTLPIARIAEFRQRFNEFAAARLSVDDFRPEYEADARLSLLEVNDESIQQVLSLAPFGYGNPAPLFAVEGAEVAGEPLVWKEKHARVRFRQGLRGVTAKAWNFAPRIAETPPGAEVDALLYFEEDNYGANRGFAPWSACLKDVRPAQPR